MGEFIKIFTMKKIPLELWKFSMDSAQRKFGEEEKCIMSIEING